MNNSLPLSSCSHLVHGSAGRSFVLICLYNSVYKKLLDAFNYLKPALQSYSPSNDALKQTFAQNIISITIL